MNLSNSCITWKDLVFGVDVHIAYASITAYISIHNKLIWNFMSPKVLKFKVTLTLNHHSSANIKKSILMAKKQKKTFLFLGSLDIRNECKWTGKYEQYSCSVFVGLLSLLHKLHTYTSSLFWCGSIQGPYIAAIHRKWPNWHFVCQLIMRIRSDSIYYIRMINIWIINQILA